MATKKKIRKHVGKKLPNGKFQRNTRVCNSTEKRGMGLQKVLVRRSLGEVVKLKALHVPLAVLTQKICFLLFDEK